ncbi:16S rRNA m(7)G-527 methyltransferase [Devosia lucknowensis]|uniref:Ribosomal RNA small subunit methyltransferase G n=1 Tax=Devosia lucknowensis TaxID=1096929 RepID=A0A1Y6G7A5_9HYPH|nr:16S rRNA (guanine(527)-N(7))-methyltransferase RsmG [Devosia lucknowensis]SMQ85995.1 16S rRNA m(7)G-527 methyltransferase [Devosia lucknowensis]
MGDIAAIQAYAGHVTRPIEAVANDLESYAKLLTKWQSVQNLVSRETLSQIWTRHFADSLQVMTLTKPSDRLFLDFGSGGGFPALPMAIASKGSDRRFVLIEPTARKVSFLRTVTRELGLNVTVIGVRSDQTDSRETGTPDVITSRALAAMPQLCTWMAPFFGPQTRALLHKGREHVEELAESGAHWHHDVLITKSDTDPGGVIVEVTNLRGKSVS